ncbi:MAG: YfhO family protein [Patescibacteria group bacterium]|nr:YfhO family protein [Patescibacteria group bacterium]
MNKFKRLWPYFLIVAVVLVFFFPILRGQIPFPGDLLIDSNPYSSQGFLGYSAGGYPNKGQGPDVVSEIYPWRYFSINQLKQGNIPFWNPHNFSGNPQMANFQTAIFYPANILYFLLPFNLSWTLIIILQPLLGGIFMYLFLRKGIGVKDFPSFIGGIAFAFSSYMVVWIEYGNIGSTILWLPLALLFTKYFFKKLNAVNFFGLSLTLTLSLLAGYIQGVFYIYLLCFLYYLYLIFVQRSFKSFKNHILFLLSLALPFLLASFQILPTLQLFSQSTRGAYSLSQIEKNLASLYYWITIVFPDFFGNPATRNYWTPGTYIERVMYPGTVILFFAFYAIFNKVNFIEKKFFLVVSIVSLIIASNLPLVKYFYLIPIPVISTTVPTREFSIFIFSLIVLGAIGLEQFLNEKYFKKIFASFYLVFLVLVWGVVLLLIRFSPTLSGNLKITEHNLILPSIIISLTVFVVFLKRINLKISLILLTALVILDLFYFFNKITPFSPESFTYPDTQIISYIKKTAGINRFWGYGSAYIPANFQTVDQTYSPEGNDPLHISRYGELLSSSLNGKLPMVLPRPDANIAPGYGPNDLKTNSYRKKILDLLGVKYILHKQELTDAWSEPDLTTFPDNQFALIKKIYPWQLYENKDVLPRFFVTGKYVLSKNKASSLSLIFSSNIDLKNTLILEKNPGLLMDTDTNAAVELLSYKPNEILFKIRSSGNGLLFLSDNYYPEWKALIDGNPSEVLIADYSFRAVAVPKGIHTVEYVYNPKSFELGIGVGIIGLISFVAVLYYVKNNKEK